MTGHRSHTTPESGGRSEVPGQTAGLRFEILHAVLKNNECLFGTAVDCEWDDLIEAIGIASTSVPLEETDTDTVANVTLANEMLRTDRDRAWKALAAIEQAFERFGYAPCSPLSDNVVAMYGDLEDARRAAVSGPSADLESLQQEWFKRGYEARIKDERDQHKLAQGGDGR